MQNLPSEIYQTQQIRVIERAAIEQFHIAEIELMARAALAALKALQAIWPEARHISIICGPGNNGGDGYYLAALAQAAGLHADVYYLSDPKALTGAAQLAYQKAQGQGVAIKPFTVDLVLITDVLVDAILGIGLQRPVTGAFAQAVHWLNDSMVPIFSLDIPTGLCSDTGAVLGTAVIADATMTFIGVKCGLVTGMAADYVGELFFADLDLPQDILFMTKPYGYALDYQRLSSLLMPRPLCTHKGDNGHVLIVGGDYGMPGAVSLAANAALRAGAGLVSVVTRSAHVPAIVAFRPEVMVYGDEQVDWPALLKRATIVVVGPGLGRSPWSEQIFLQAVQTDKPLVIDADGLYFMKQHKIRHATIITPHPGETAMLLDTTSQAVQANRYQALQLLRKQFPKTLAVLKGAGSLLLDYNGLFYFSRSGNPGMASAGMGDMLTGVIAGLLGQGLEALQALMLGVEIHAMAGDFAANDRGERGMIATDLLPFIQILVNVND